jgi:hypothetical protein
VADAAATIGTAMDHRPIANEHAIPDLECLSVTYADIRPDHQTIATMPHEGAQAAAS